MCLCANLQWQNVFAGGVSSLSVLITASHFCGSRFLEANTQDWWVAILECLVKSVSTIHDSLLGL